MSKKLRNYLLFLSFLEGGAVMAAELLSAKLIAPYFGSSLYVWAAVLGVTLTALMTGYYLGGYISGKYKSIRTIFYVLGLAGLLLALLPPIGKAVMSSTLEMSVQAGSTISLCIFMLPPLLLMGMTSPLIINAINEQVETSGKSAGSIYAISTFGGIISTFLLGFYLMPNFGIVAPALFIGLGLLLFCCVGLLLQKKYVIALFIILFGSILAYASKPQEAKNEQYKVLYRTEGILGQIKVIEHMYPTYSRGQMLGRVLLVNNTGQTIMDANDPDYSLWDWSYYFPSAASVFSKNSKVLLLGLGGGTLVKQFERLNFELDVVEIDERVVEVAIEYFAVDPKTNIMVDDARHYINTCQETYDIVTMDLFLNETPPAHVMSVESFRRINEILSPDGMVMMNFYGYIEGDHGLASRCVYKTFVEAGFNTHLFVTPGLEDGRNLIFLACKGEPNFTNVTYSEPGLPALGDITTNFLDVTAIDFSDAEVLTDEIPKLEELYAIAALDWRKFVNQLYTIPFAENNVGTFE